MRERTHEQKEAIQLWTAIIFRGTLVVLGLLALFYYLLPFLYERLKTVLLMLIISIFFCYLIAPLVRVFEQPLYAFGREIKLPRVGAIAVVYLLFGAIFFMALQFLLPILTVQLTELARNLPEYANSSITWLNKMTDDANVWMSRLRIPREWRTSILKQVEAYAISKSPELKGFVEGLFSSLGYLLWLVLVPILSFFMLKDADRFAKAVVALMPTERLQKRAYWLLLDASKTLAIYIRTQITACLMIGVLVTIGLLIMGVPYAVLLGLISAILEFIPMVGPIAAALITFGLTLTTSLKLAVGVAIFLAVLRLIQDYMIYPRLVGQGIKMHPLVVVLAILCGEKIGGLIGIFLAIPFVGLMIVFYNHYVAYQTLSAQSALEPRSVVDNSIVPEPAPMTPIGSDPEIGPSPSKVNI